MMISQKMIAEKLGMPVSTVANILNGTPNYKKETCDRVLKVAEQLGYQPNRASQAIKRGRSNLIGVVHFGSPYSTAHAGIESVVKTLGEHGYDHLVIDSHWHAGNGDLVLSEVIKSRVEGVLLIANTESAPGPVVMNRLRQTGIPVVSLFGENPSDIPLIGNSSKGGFFSMSRHLQHLGHRGLLLVVSSSNEYSSLARIEGFRDAMEGRGTCSILAEEEFFEEWPRIWKKNRKNVFGVVVRIDMKRFDGDVLRANYELGKSLFSLGALPDAIMCSNDSGACGIFNAAYEMNIRIPVDIAVTGCDNEKIGTFPMFRLTSIQFDIASSALKAVEVLMKLLKKEKLPERKISFPADLVLRQSCGRMVGPEGSEVFVPTGKEGTLSEKDRKTVKRPIEPKNQRRS